VARAGSRERNWEWKRWLMEGGKRWSGSMGGGARYDMSYMSIHYYIKSE